MREIKKEEMIKVEGGTNGIFIGSVIGIVVTFIVGVLHGYSNPKTCND